MKKLFLAVALLTVIGCGKDKPVIVDPGPVPVAHKEAEFCQPAGKQLHCGTNEWWHMDCGGNVAEEQVYFNSIEELMSKASEHKIDSCIIIKHKNGSEQVVPEWPGYVGFGPCITCPEL